MGNNTMRALSLRRYDRDANLRLLLLRPESKQIAIRMGIEETRCLSVNELKSSLLAISTQCQGYATLISNLLETSESIRQEAKAHLPDWAQNYFGTMDARFIGFCIAPKFVGQTWSYFVEKCIERNIIPLAV